jgi:hypothetical protein
MDIIDNKSDHQLHQSIVAEMAKAQNELRCARRDVDKANNRLAFVLALANALLERHKD